MAWGAVRDRLPACADGVPPPAPGHWHGAGSWSRLRDGGRPQFPACVCRQHVAALPVGREVSPGRAGGIAVGATCPQGPPLPTHRLEYLQQKLSRATSEEERQALEKQCSKAEREIRDIK